MTRASEKKVTALKTRIRELERELEKRARAPAAELKAAHDDIEALRGAARVTKARATYNRSMMRARMADVVELLGGNVDWSDK